MFLNMVTVSVFVISIVIVVVIVIAYIHFTLKDYHHEYNYI